MRSARAYARIDERPRADGVCHHWGADLVREANLAQVDVGIPVVEQASAAKDEQVEVVEDLLRLTPRRAG